RKTVSETPPTGPLARQVSLTISGQERRDKLDPKHPSPARVLGQHTAEHWAQHTRRSQHRADDGGDILLGIIGRDFGHDDHRDAVQAWGGGGTKRPSPLL